MMQEASATAEYQWAEALRKQDVVHSNLAVAAELRCLGLLLSELLRQRL